MTQHDRRRLKRKNLTYYMPVVDPKTEQIIGHLVDISPQGLMMDSQQVFMVGQDYRLRLNVTVDVADKNYIDFSARTKWCRPDTAEPYLYDIGFEINKISAVDAEVIRRIVEKYGSREGYS
jgi:Tfp pilus assembly protein PilZ